MTFGRGDVKMQRWGTRVCQGRPFLSAWGVCGDETAAGVWGRSVRSLIDSPPQVSRELYLHFARFQFLPSSRFVETSNAAQILLIHSKRYILLTYICMCDV